MNRLAVVATLAILTSGCGERVTSPIQPSLLTNDLTFYRFDAAAFEHVPRHASFWAVKGENRRLVLHYSDTKAEFLRFDVGAESLSLRPDGTRFEDGDSVRISVEVDAEGLMVFRFAPSGLKFNASQPARLTIDRKRSDPDIDRNGYVGLGDALLDLRSGIWKQELPLLPWLKVPSINLFGNISRADVHDFTGFGMAVN